MIRFAVIVTVVLIALTAFASVSAENYVNWKGGFWVDIPDAWGKVDYIQVDRILAMADTAAEVFNYEAVLAPISSETFLSGPYIVITYDETGELSKNQADSVLRDIASNYASDILEAPSSARLADLTPGQPQMSTDDLTVQVLSEMAYQSNNKTKLWLYMKLHQTKGLVTFYMYCPDYLYTETQPVFEKLVSSLSFEGLKEAAGKEDVTYTDVKGGDGSKSSLLDANENGTSEEDSGYMFGIYIIIGVIVVGVILVLIMKSRRKKNEENISE